VEIAKKPSAAVVVALLVLVEVELLVAMALPLQCGIFQPEQTEL